jgi:integrase
VSKSTRSRRARKAPERPKKPYPDFPLYPHPLGYWSKKILGRIHYFGRWARVVDGKLTPLPYDAAWKEALEQFQVQRDDLYAGRTPRVSGDQLTVGGLCNHFLTAKQQRLKAGKLGSRMFAEYKGTTDLIVAAFGVNRSVEDLGPGDFQGLGARIADCWGPVREGNTITRVKSVFKFGLENGLIERAVRYGTEFQQPSRATMRKHKAEAGPKMLEAEELRRLLGHPPWAPAAEGQLKAMILLAVNCGFGNTDLATLPLSAIDLDRGWVRFPRPKTGVDRKCWLWPETVAALGEVLASRKKPAGFDGLGLVFINSRGSTWVKAVDEWRSDKVSIAFRTLLKRLGMHRKGLGFYSLRSTHRTVADGAKDPVACDVIMGRVDATMGGHYRQRVEDDRVKAVAEHVRRWLFPPPTKLPSGKGKR